MPSGLQAGGAQRRRGRARPCRGARRRAGRAARRPVGVVDDAERLVVEHGLVERHRDLVLRLEAHGGRELLGVLEVRQVDDAHDDLLVGDADAHALAEALVARGTASRSASARPSTSATSPSRMMPGLERRDGGALDAHAAVDARPDGGDDAGARCRARRGSWCAWPWRRRGARRLGCRDAPPLIGSAGPDLRRAPELRPTCVHGRDRRGRRAQKVSRYASTSSSPTKQRDHAAEREERAERHRRLAALLGALARDDRGADDDAGDERDEHAPAPPRARGTGRARRRASRRPCPSRAGRRARRGGRSRRAAAPAMSCSGTKSVSSASRSRRPPRRRPAP